MRFMLPCAYTAAAVTVVLGGHPAAHAFPAFQPPARVDSAAEARTLIDRAAESYRGLRTYSDEALIRHETHWAGNPQAQAHEARLEFVFAAPNRFILRNERGGAYCDGERLWLHDAEQAVYSEAPAPAAIPLDDLDHRVPAVHLASHPIARLLLTGEPAARAWGIDEVLARQDEPREGVTGHRVRASGRGDIPGQGTAPMTLWLRDAPALLGEIAVDLTGAFRAANPDDRDARASAARVLRVSLNTRLVGVRVDEPLPPEKFAFVPAPADRRVDEIRSPLERMLASERSMIGRPAPPIGGPLLDGGEFGARDAADRVVVLYFWDTGSPVSVAALPRTTALAERLRAEPVMVLNVNQDRADAADVVRRIVRREGATPPQLLDIRGDLARALALSGIPSTVVIDRAGVIRGIYPGPLGAHEDEIAERARALAQ